MKREREGTFLEAVCGFDRSSSIGLLAVRSSAVGFLHRRRALSTEHREPAQQPRRTTTTTTHLSNSQPALLLSTSCQHIARAHLACASSVDPLQRPTTQRTSLDTRSAQQASWPHVCCSASPRSIDHDRIASVKAPLLTVPVAPPLANRAGLTQHLSAPPTTTRKKHEGSHGTRPPPEMVRAVEPPPKAAQFVRRIPEPGTLRNVTDAPCAAKHHTDTL